ncbi:DUF1772 domain-containing protein [Actinocrispum sp. NPDC049592]|uniref:anthrone oxygenase family protein n=1 Tax=Actinocrispum sp. NPDC049592 TaxID=3154835 RepID=UPI003417834A
MDVVRGALLVISTLAVGFQAGLFYTFGVSVMRTLKGVDDKTFVNVMQRINRDIQNAGFGLTFAGGLVFGVISLLLVLGSGAAVLAPVIIGVVLYIISLGITFRGNIPMNIRLDRAGHPDKLSNEALSSARKQFEDPWTRANAIRMLFALGAAAAFCVGLIGL